MKDTLILLPTYNEEENILEIVEALKERSDLYDLLVIDDNSPDRTGELVKRVMNNEDWVTLLTRGEKNGLGEAYKSGMGYAIGKEYKYVVTMDADFSHDPRVIPDLLKHIDNSSVLIGSRYIAGGKVENWGFIRYNLSYYGNKYYKLMTGSKVNDLTSGFRVYKVDKLKEIKISRIGSKGYAFQAEMVVELARSGGIVMEYPILFKDRVKGESKMSLKITVESLFLAHRFLIDRIRNRNLSKFSKKQ